MKTLLRQKEDRVRALDSRRQAMRCRDIAAMFGENSESPAEDSLLKAAWITTPIGLMVAIADRHALHLLEFIERPALATEVRMVRAAAGCSIGLGASDMTERVKAALDAYFSGTDLRPDLYPGLRLAAGGTYFQKQVWRALQAIEPGRTGSYSGLAADIGRPDAIRAVARANGANRFAILVPCHRLLGADGALTGYGGGLWRKDWLLQHEKCRATLDERTDLPASSPPRDLLGEGVFGAMQDRAC